MHALDSHQASILKAYTSGTKCRVLATQYSVPYITMWKYLKARGCAFQRLLLTDDQRMAFVADHESGMRYRELGEKYGISTASAKNYALRHGLRAHGQYRKKIINHAFFDTLTEESLWVLGWMYSDGNVSSSSNHFNLCVHRDDEDLLRTVGRLMGSEVESIYRPKDRKVSYFFGCDGHLHTSLVELGCMPNKSLVIRYPSFLTEDWQHWAFLRGAWEGDGHLSIKAPKRNRSGFNCELSSGSRPFLEAIQTLLKTKLDIDTTIIEREGTHGRRLVILGGPEPILRFLGLIYQNGNAKHVLTRKRDMYLRMIEVNNRPREPAFFDRAKCLDAHFISPDGIIYHASNISSFAREFGLDKSSMFMLNKKGQGHILKWSKWGTPTADQIATAKASGSLIERVY